jgi:hypothetical protein
MGPASCLYHARRGRRGRIGFRMSGLPARYLLGKYKIIITVQHWLAKRVNNIAYENIFFEFEILLTY